MLHAYPVFALMFLISQTSVATPVLRLQGLDRLYFKHVGGPGDPLVAPSFARLVPALLPETIQPKSPSGRTDGKRKLSDEIETEAEIRDFQLPLRDTSKKLFLRQVVVSNAGARITKLWWALYDDWRRGDVWYFQMEPEQNDDKALSNYETSRFRPRTAVWS
jgi:hypothetical protein